MRIGMLVIEHFRGVDEREAASELIVAEYRTGECGGIAEEDALIVLCMAAATELKDQLAVPSWSWPKRHRGRIGLRVVQ